MIGEVASTGNLNARLTGERNKGQVFNNMNLNLSSVNSSLNLSNNMNASVSIENSKLEMANCPNPIIFGNGNKAQLRNNSNSSFRGNGNKWEASSELNNVVIGDNNVIRLQNNSNAYIQGDGGQITADNNLNLKVSGDGNKLTITGTRNHSVKPSAELNQVEIIPVMQNCYGLFTSGTFSNWTYHVVYVDEGVIDRESYRLGMFNFLLRYTAANNLHEVTVDETGLDPGSLVFQQMGTDKVLISATKNGAMQSLQLKGPQVTQIEPPTGTTFRVSIL